jgi:mono/diheme cytochrome c family protein
MKQRYEGLWIAVIFCAAAMGGEKSHPLPAPSEKKISFGKDVKAILAHTCFECHGSGKKKGGLSMMSREALLKGGENGPAVVAGKSAESALIKRLVSGDAEEVMPQKKERLKDDEIAILRAWIDQGLVWDEPIVDREKKISIAPRKPAIADAAANPVDALLTPYFAKNPAPAKLVDDAVFARRIYMDVLGLPPTPQQLEEFAADAAPDKRAKLVEKVLADTNGYAAHWMTFWSDILRNGTTLAGIDGHANVNITPWLDAALKNNMPYNQFVSDLLSGKKETEAFLAGVVMRGVVPASQTKEMQAAQTIGQVFLGVQLKCASCHDSFVSRFTLEDAYGLATVFSDKPLELVRCEVPQGKTAPMRFLYSELGEMDSKLPRPQRLARLGELMTKKENGQLTRTIVNRLWGRFFGRALVDPVDEMENPAWNPDLLDWLASDLADNNYDLKKTMSRMLTSKAYQMASVEYKKDTSGKAFVFRGPSVRRISAEQYLDATYALLAIPRRAHQEKSTPLMESLGRPDRNNVATTRDTDASTLQALELINGPDLQKILTQDGAKKIQALVAETKASKADFMAKIYLQALGRKPTAQEFNAIESAFPGALTNEVATDIIWAMLMLPEFQLIR